MYLAASVPCHGSECAVDTARVVRVDSGDAAQPAVYYEYVRQSCVELQFFNEGYLVEGYTANDRWTAQCARPDVAAAFYI